MDRQDCQWQSPEHHQDCQGCQVWNPVYFIIINIIISIFFFFFLHHWYYILNIVDKPVAKLQAVHLWPWYLKYYTYYQQASLELGQPQNLYCMVVNCNNHLSAWVLQIPLWLQYLLLYLATRSCFMRFLATPPTPRCLWFLLEPIAADYCWLL